MPHDRFFTDTILQQGEIIILEDEEAHHLNVMRKSIGDRVELVNGKNALAMGIIENQNKKGISLRVEETKLFPSPTYSIILAQALPKMNRLELIVEKATELGATSIWLFPGTKSEKTDINDNQLHRLRKITIAAMKQCGRLDLPEITFKPDLFTLEKLPFPSYFGDTSEEAPPFAKAFTKKDGIIIFIGPEAGFTDKEISFLKTLNAQGVRLHPNILRTETAGIVALSQIQMGIQN